MTGTGCTQGSLTAGESVRLRVESDRLVAFGDGIESDSVPLAWGQQVAVGLSARTLRLVR